MADLHQDLGAKLFQAEQLIAQIEPILDARRARFKDANDDPDITAIQDEYLDTLDEAANDLWSDKISQEQFRDRVRDALLALAIAIYLAGLGSNDEADLTDEDRSRIDDWTALQLGFIDDLSAAALAAKSDAALQPALLSRLTLWSGALAAFGYLSKAETMRNRLGQWRYGATEQHCETCKMLSEESPHRVSWFVDNGYIPRQAGSEVLECGGWRCDCGVFDVKTGERLL